MSESLRFVVEVAAPLASKMGAFALVALSFDFAIMSLTQLRTSREAEAAGADLFRYRLAVAFKIVSELSGLLVVIFKEQGTLGAVLVLLGHAAFHRCDSLGSGVVDDSGF